MLQPKIVLPIAALMVVAVVFVNARTNNVQGYVVGDIAKDFALVNVDGNPVSMASYNQAKGFIVVFTCNSCPFAKLYEDRINQLNQKYEPKGFPVIAINPNDAERMPEDSFDNMKTRAAEKDFTYPYLWDETQDVTRAYGATRTPHIYVLNKESGNKLRVAYIGAIDNNHRDENLADKKYVEDAVDALLAKNEVPVKTTKAIGCTIKWKDS